MRRRTLPDFRQYSRNRPLRVPSLLPEYQQTLPFELLTPQTRARSKGMARHFTHRDGVVLHQMASALHLNHGWRPTKGHHLGQLSALGIHIAGLFAGRAPDGLIARCARDAMKLERQSVLGAMSPITAAMHLLAECLKLRFPKLLLLLQPYEPIQGPPQPAAAPQPSAAPSYPFLMPTETKALRLFWQPRSERLLLAYGRPPKPWFRSCGERRRRADTRQRSSYRLAPAHGVLYAGGRPRKNAIGR